MNSMKNKQKEAELYNPAQDQLYNQSRKAMQILIDAGFEARLAGGCVRDRLLQRRPKDYDIATNAIPDEVCTVFKQKNMKVVPTGLDHGTVTLVMAGQPIEITTLRRDVATDGRRAVVAFSQSFEEDAARRDLTINALFEDIHGQIFDFVGGLDDLKARRLRFVGDPCMRMREDYLRILRLFRFWARYDFQPDPQLLPLVEKEAPGLQQISQERKTSELLQILEADRVSGALQSMLLSKVLPEILPVTSIDPHIDDLKLEKNQSIARLAFLLKDSAPAELKKLLQSLRLSTQQVETIVILIDAEIPPAAARVSVLMEAIDQWENKMADGGLENILLPYWLHQNLLDASLEQRLLEAGHNPRRRAKLPLDGSDLMKTLGLSPGPLLGKMVLDLKNAYRDGLWTTADEGLAWCRAYSQ